MRYWLRSVAGILLVALTAQDVSWAAPLVSLSPEPEPLSIQVPPEIASIKGSYRGAGPLLIHIQDAHSNLGAQKNIAKALEEILTKHRIRTVFVEGGTQDVSLNFLRIKAPVAARRRVAEEFLMKGELSGAEYLDLASDLDMRLIGVEDPALYRRNLTAYAEVARSRQRSLAFLDEIRKRLEQLKRRHYPGHLLSLDEVLAALDAGGTDFGEYHDRIFEAASEAGVNWLGYPEISMLAALKKEEKAIDLGRAQAGEPQELKKYKAYIERSAKIDAERFLEEMEQLRDEVFGRALRDPDSARLYRIDRWLRNRRTLSTLQASKEDVDEYRRSRQDRDLHALSVCAFLNRLLMDAGNDTDVIVYQPEYETAQAAVEEFYRVAQERDEVFVRKALSLMREDEISAAVLVAGGYHTQNLRRLLKERNVSHVVVSPVIGQESNLKRYEKMLMSQLESAGASAGPAGHLSVAAAAQRPLLVQELGARLADLASERVPATGSPLAGEKALKIAEMAIKRLDDEAIAGAVERTLDRFLDHELALLSRQFRVLRRDEVAAQIKGMIVPWRYPSDVFDIVEMPGLYVRTANDALKAHGMSESERGELSHALVDIGRRQLEFGIYLPTLDRSSFFSGIRRHLRENTEDTDRLVGIYAEKLLESIWRHLRENTEDADRLVGIYVEELLEELKKKSRVPSPAPSLLARVKGWIQSLRSGEVHRLEGVELEAWAEIFLAQRLEGSYLRFTYRAASDPPRTVRKASGYFRSFHRDKGYFVIEFSDGMRNAFVGKMPVLPVDRHGSIRLLSVFPDTGARMTDSDHAILNLAGSIEVEPSRVWRWITNYWREAPEGWRMDAKTIAAWGPSIPTLDALIDDVKRDESVISKRLRKILRERITEILIERLATSSNDEVLNTSVRQLGLLGGENAVHALVRHSTLEHRIPLLRSILNILEDHMDDTVVEKRIVEIAGDKTEKDPTEVRQLAQRILNDARRAHMKRLEKLHSPVEERQVIQMTKKMSRQQLLDLGKELMRQVQDANGVAIAFTYQKKTKEGGLEFVTTEGVFTGFGTIDHRWVYIVEIQGKQEIFFIEEPSDNAKEKKQVLFVEREKGGARLSQRPYYFPAARFIDRHSADTILPEGVSIDRETGQSFFLHPKDEVDTIRWVEVMTQKKGRIELRRHAFGLEPIVLSLTDSQPGISFFVDAALNKAYIRQMSVQGDRARYQVSPPTDWSLSLQKPQTVPDIDAIDHVMKLLSRSPSFYAPRLSLSPEDLQAVRYFLSGAMSFAEVRRALEPHFGHRKAEYLALAAYVGAVRKLDILAILGAYAYLQYPYLAANYYFALRQLRRDEADTIFHWTDSLYSDWKRADGSEDTAEDLARLKDRILERIGGEPADARQKRIQFGERRLNLDQMDTVPWALAFLEHVEWEIQDVIKKATFRLERTLKKLNDPISAEFLRQEVAKITTLTQARDLLRVLQSVFPSILAGRLKELIDTRQAESRAVQLRKAMADGLKELIQVRQAESRAVWRRIGQRMFTVDQLTDAGATLSLELLSAIRKDAGARLANEIRRIEPSVADQRRAIAQDVQDLLHQMAEEHAAFMSGRASSPDEIGPWIAREAGRKYDMLGVSELEALAQRLGRLKDVIGARSLEQLLDDPASHHHFVRQFKLLNQMVTQIEANHKGEAQARVETPLRGGLSLEIRYSHESGKVAVLVFRRDPALFPGDRPLFYPVDGAVFDRRLEDFFQRLAAYLDEKIAADRGFSHKDSYRNQTTEWLKTFPFKNRDIGARLAKEPHSVQEWEALLLKVAHHLGIRSGNPLQAEMAVYRWKPRYMSYAQNKGLSPEDAEETAHDVILKVIMNVDSFMGKNEAAFTTWAHRILINTVKNALRYKRRHPSGASLEGMKLDTPSDGPAPDRQYDLIEMDKVFQQALKALPIEYRTLLAFAMMDHSYEEMAQMLGVTVGTVKSRLSKARTELRRMVLPQVRLARPPDTATGARLAADLVDEQAAIEALRALQDDATMSNTLFGMASKNVTSFCFVSRIAILSLFHEDQAVRRASQALIQRLFALGDLKLFRPGDLQSPTAAGLIARRLYTWVLSKGSYERKDLVRDLERIYGPDVRAVSEPIRISEGTRFLMLLLSGAGPSTLLAVRSMMRTASFPAIPENRALRQAIFGRSDVSAKPIDATTLGLYLSRGESFLFQKGDRKMTMALVGATVQDVTFDLQGFKSIEHQGASVSNGRRTFGYRGRILLDGDIVVRLFHRPGEREKERVRVTIEAPRSVIIDRGARGGARLAIPPKPAYLRQLLEGVGEATPDWQRMNLLAGIILDRPNNGLITLHEILGKAFAAFKSHGIPAPDSVTMGLMDRMTSLELLRKTDEGYALAVSKRLLATKMKNSYFIRDELARLLESGDEKTLRDAIVEYAEVADLWHLSPIEARWPFMTAVKLMTKKQQAALLAYLSGSGRDLRRHKLVDAVLLNSEANPTKGWLERFAPGLKGRSLYLVSPEIWHLGGGLGRVVQYMVARITKLVRRLVRVVTIEPYYPYRLNHRGEREPVDYTTLPEPVQDLSRVPVYEFEVKVRNSPVKAKIYRGTNRYGAEVYLIKDSGDFYTKLLYKYGPEFGTATWEEFSEFFSRASLQLIQLLENEKHQKEGDAYRPAVISLNDGQLGLFPILKRIADGSGDPSQNVLSRALVWFVTHTYRNRGIYGESTGRGILQAILRRPNLLHKWTSYFNRIGLIDFTSAGRRAADATSGVATVHSTEVASIDPTVIGPALTNGDNLEASGSVFEKIFPGDMTEPDVASIRTAKAEAKRQASQNERLIELDPEFKRMDPSKPVFGYFGRLVEEKAGLERAFGPRKKSEGKVDLVNLRRLVADGAQVVLAVNVQSHTQDIFDELKAFQKEVNAKGLPGRLFVITGWSTPEQVSLLAATDIQVQDSDRGTEAAGYTESNAKRNAAIELTITGLEGILQNQGIIIDRDRPGIGDTLIPAHPTADGYWEVYRWALDLYWKDPAHFASYQATALRTSGVLDAIHTAAENLRQFDAAMRRKEDPVSVLSDLIRGDATAADHLLNEWLRKDLTEVLERVGDIEIEDTNNPELRAFILRTDGLDRIVVIQPSRRETLGPETRGRLRTHGNDAFRAYLERLRAQNEDVLWVRDAVTGVTYDSYSMDDLTSTGLGVIVRDPGIQVLELIPQGARLAQGERSGSFWKHHLSEPSVQSMAGLIQAAMSYYPPATWSDSRNDARRMAETMEDLLGTDFHRIREVLISTAMSSADDSIYLTGQLRIGERLEAFAIEGNGDRLDIKAGSLIMGEAAQVLFTGARMASVEELFLGLKDDTSSQEIETMARKSDSPGYAEMTDMTVLTLMHEDESMRRAAMWLLTRLVSIRKQHGFHQAQHRLLNWVAGEWARSRPAERFRRLHPNASMVSEEERKRLGKALLRKIVKFGGRSARHWQMVYLRKALTTEFGRMPFNQKLIHDLINEDSAPAFKRARASKQAQRPQPASTDTLINEHDRLQREEGRRMSKDGARLSITETARAGWRAYAHERKLRALMDAYIDADDEDARDLVGTTALNLLTPVLSEYASLHLKSRHKEPILRTPLVFTLIAADKGLSEEGWRSLESVVDHMNRESGLPPVTIGELANRSIADFIPDHAEYVRLSKNLQHFIPDRHRDDLNLSALAIQGPHHYDMDLEDAVAALPSVRHALEALQRTGIAPELAAYFKTGIAFVVHNQIKLLQVMDANPSVEVLGPDAYQDATEYEDYRRWVYENRDRLALILEERFRDGEKKGLMPYRIRWSFSSRFFKEYGRRLPYGFTKFILDPPASSEIFASMAENPQPDLQLSNIQGVRARYQSAIHYLRTMRPGARLATHERDVLAAIAAAEQTKKVEWRKIGLGLASFKVLLTFALVPRDRDWTRRPGTIYFWDEGAAAGYILRVYKQSGEMWYEAVVRTAVPGTNDDHIDVIQGRCAELEAEAVLLPEVRESIFATYDQPRREATALVHYVRDRLEPRSSDAMKLSTALNYLKVHGGRVKIDERVKMILNETRIGLDNGDPTMQHHANLLDIALRLLTFRMDGTDEVHMRLVQARLDALVEEDPNAIQELNMHLWYGMPLSEPVLAEMKHLRMLATDHGLRHEVIRQTGHIKQLSDEVLAKESEKDGGGARLSEPVAIIDGLDRDHLVMLKRMVFEDDRGPFRTREAEVVGELHHRFDHALWKAMSLGPARVRLMQRINEEGIELEASPSFQSEIRPKLKKALEDPENIFLRGMMVAFAHDVGLEGYPHPEFELRTPESDQGWIEFAQAVYVAQSAEQRAKLWPRLLGARLGGEPKAMLEAYLKTDPADLLSQKAAVQGIVALLSSDSIRPLARQYLQGSPLLIAALFALDRGLTEEEWELLEKALEHKNSLDPRRSMSMADLLLDSIAPYIESDEYIRLSNNLTRVPERFRAEVVIADLLSQGIHLTIIPNDQGFGLEVEDHTSVLPSFQYALEFVRRPDADPEVVRRMKTAMARMLVESAEFLRKTEITRGSSYETSAAYRNWIYENRDELQSIVHEVSLQETGQDRVLVSVFRLGWEFRTKFWYVFGGQIEGSLTDFLLDPTRHRDEILRIFAIIRDEAPREFVVRDVDVVRKRFKDAEDYLDGMSSVADEGAVTLAGAVDASTFNVIGARLVAALRPATLTNIPLQIADAVALVVVSPAYAAVRRVDDHDLLTGETLWEGPVDILAHQKGARLSGLHSSKADGSAEKTKDLLIKGAFPATKALRIRSDLEISVAPLASIRDPEHFEVQFTDLVRGIVQFHGTPVGKKDLFYLTRVGSFNDRQYQIARRVLMPYREFIRFGIEASGEWPTACIELPEDDARPDGKLHFPTSPIQADEVMGAFSQIYIASMITKALAPHGRLDIQGLSIADITDQALEAYALRANERPSKEELFLMITRRGTGLATRFRMVRVARYALEETLRILKGARLSILGSA